MNFPYVVIDGTTHKAAPDEQTECGQVVPINAARTDLRVLPGDDKCADCFPKKAKGGKA